MDGSIGLRPAAASAKTESPPLDTKSAPVAGSPAANSLGSGVPPPTILRAAPSTHSLVYRADLRGHVALTALVNGAPVRFLVDTGASRVTLTLDDARAAGIGGNELVYNQRSQTANGLAREAVGGLRALIVHELVAADTGGARVVEGQRNPARPGINEKPNRRAIDQGCERDMAAKISAIYERVRRGRCPEDGGRRNTAPQ